MRITWSHANEGLAQSLAEKNPLGIHIQMQIGGFPGGPVVKNQPAKAGDTGSIPVSTDICFHMLLGNWTIAPTLHN